MNCIVQATSWLLNKLPNDIYNQIGHCEPIHMDEIVAYLLTVGYALVPRDEPDFDLSQFKLFVEGFSVGGEPHIIGTHSVDDLTYEITGEKYKLQTPYLYWYIIPCVISETYVYEWKQLRDAWLTSLQRDEEYLWKQR